MIHEGGPRGYPRPQFRRESWLTLDGEWAFAIDRDAAWQKPEDVSFEARINVPFAPETPRSGIDDRGFYSACWYRREFEAHAHREGERVLLHFGAVDTDATVWVNGEYAGEHLGGYTPFEFDITDWLRTDGVQEVVVRAFDDPHDLAKPRGKQDWQLEAHSIWYPRTTGIWQSVWLEVVPATRLRGLGWTSSVERREIGFETELAGVERDDLQVRVRLSVAGTTLVDDTYRMVKKDVTRRIALPDPGIDDARDGLLWSPRHPTLIDAEVELQTIDGEVIDRVWSYTALRSVGTEGDRFVLNGRPYRLRLVLDQGYWPDTGMTAPDDDTIRRDVELVRAMGFNGVRKHQKIEDPRYLYWADVLGVLVWEEMPSAYAFTQRAVERLTREWLDVIERDASHPCIVAWVPFNESWGVSDLPSVEAQRDYVRAIYHLTRTLDPSRPVIGNDGWESVAADIIGIHDYDPEPDRIAERYATYDVADLLERERPGGRRLLAPGQTYEGQPLMLTEFGGIALSRDDDGTWGYTRARTAEDLADRYHKLVSAVRALSVMSGFCYTQFADTYQEANGLLYADRTPKFPLEEMSSATRGRRPK